MTVYELIKELTRHAADTEVQIRAVVPTDYVRCLACDTAVEVSEDVFNCDVDDVTNKNDRGVFLHCMVC